MKRIIFLLWLLPMLVIAQEKSALEVQDFKTKISDPNAILLDVRTHEEFYSGHIEKALNKDFYDADFDLYCNTLAKDKVYIHLLFHRHAQP